MKESTMIAQFRGLNDRVNKIGVAFKGHNDLLNMTELTFIAIKKLLIDKGVAAEEELLKYINEEIDSYNERMKDESKEDSDDSTNENDSAEKDSGSN